MTNDVRELDLMWFDLKCPKCGFGWSWFAEMALLPNGASAALSTEHASCWRCKYTLKAGDPVDPCRDNDEGHEISRITYLIPVEA